MQGTAMVIVMVITVAAVGSNDLDGEEKDINPGGRAGFPPAIHTGLCSSLSSKQLHIKLPFTINTLMT